jgi:uncharacterized protein (DUF2384 family)
MFHIRIAEETFGSAEKATSWLSVPIRRLENKIPMAVLDTEAGLRRAREMLSQIDKGMFT